MFPFNKNAKIGRTTILNRIKIGRGMVLSMNLNTDFTDFADFADFNYKMIRLYFKLSSPKLINNPILFFDAAK